MLFLARLANASALLVRILAFCSSVSLSHAFRLMDTASNASACMEGAANAASTSVLPLDLSRPGPGRLFFLRSRNPFPARLQGRKGPEEGTACEDAPEGLPSGSYHKGYQHSAHG